MAVIGNRYPTLKDWAKHLDPGGRYPVIVESLQERNEILEDMVWEEGNLPTGHRTTRRSELPTVDFKALNQGVTPSKSSVSQVEDVCGIIAGFSEVDADLAELSNRAREFRASEDEAFLQSFNNRASQSLIYGDHKDDPRAFDGFTVRYSPGNPEIAGQLINAGGSGNSCTSIWLVGWGKETIHGIFPQGSKAGWYHEDLGKVQLTDKDGGRYLGYQTSYKWKLGLCVRDFRFAARIANIDTLSLSKDAGAGADLIDLMMQAIELLPERQVCQPAFYCNRVVRSFLRRQISNKANVFLSLNEAGGKSVVGFDGVPVRRTDAILNNETALTF